MIIKKTWITSLRTMAYTMLGANECTDVANVLLEQSNILEQAMHAVKDAEHKERIELIEKKAEMKAELMEKRLALKERIGRAHV